MCVEGGVNSWVVGCRCGGGDICGDAGEWVCMELTPTLGQVQPSLVIVSVYTASLVVLI